MTTHKTRYPFQEETIMKAVGYQQSLEISHPDALLDINMPVPRPSDHDLLVKVGAISVNPVDTKVRKRAAPEASHYKILGWDAVGEVVETGKLVTNFSKGDKVYYAGDLTRQGSNAEYQVVDARIVGKPPNSLSNAEAAALPLTTITAWELLFDRLCIERQQKTSTTFEAENDRPTLLIIGAAGGVGSILVQLAARLTNAIVIGTASRLESQQWVKGMGADFVIDHSQPLVQELKKIGIDSVTHVASLTATDQHFEAIAECIAPQGKLALIDDPEAALDIKKLKFKSVSLHWEFMYTRSMFQTDDMSQQQVLLNQVSHYIDTGLLKTTQTSHYGVINAENLKRAHADLEKAHTIGKIVLEGF